MEGRTGFREPRAEGPGLALKGRGPVVGLSPLSRAWGARTNKHARARAPPRFCALFAGCSRNSDRCDPPSLNLPVASGLRRLLSGGGGRRSGTSLVGDAYADFRNYSGTTLGLARLPSAPIFHGHVPKQGHPPLPVDESCRTGCDVRARQLENMYMPDGDGDDNEKNKGGHPKGGNL